MCKYRYEDPYYILYDIETDTKICLSEEIAIAFTTAPDGMMWTMHKHGPPELVNRWARMARIKYIKHGLSDIAKELVVIEGQFPIKEINKIIEITGYIEKFCEKSGYEPLLFKKV